MVETADDSSARRERRPGGRWQPWPAAAPGNLAPVAYDQMLAYLNPLAPAAAGWRLVAVPRRDDEEPLLAFEET